MDDAFHQSLGDKSLFKDISQKLTEKRFQTVNERNLTNMYNFSNEKCKKERIANYARLYN